MAKVGRPKTYANAKALQRAVDAYFDAISMERQKLIAEPAMKMRPDGTMEAVKDSWGHDLIVWRPATNRKGAPIMETVWLEPPSFAGLCVFLGVHTTTFLRWRKGEGETEEENEFCSVAGRAGARIEKYLAEKALEKNASRGAIAQLEANFGYKRRREIDIGADTRKEIAKTKTLQEKLADLQEMGILMGMEDTEQEDQDNDD